MAIRLITGLGTILMDTPTDHIRTMAMAPITRGVHTTGTAGIAITATIDTINTTVIGIIN
jgi:hypothetical protein